MRKLGLNWAGGRKGSIGNIDPAISNCKGKRIVAGGDTGENSWKEPQFT
jgi:hypothetical protein